MMRLPTARTMKSLERSSGHHPIKICTLQPKSSFGPAQIHHFGRLFAAFASSAMMPEDRHRRALIHFGSSFQGVASFKAGNTRMFSCVVKDKEGKLPVTQPYVGIPADLVCLLVQNDTECIRAMHFGFCWNPAHDPDVPFLIGKGSKIHFAQINWIGPRVNDLTVPAPGKRYCHMSTACAFKIHLHKITRSDMKTISSKHLCGRCH